MRKDRVIARLTMEVEAVRELIAKTAGALRDTTEAVRQFWFSSAIAVNGSSHRRAALLLLPGAADNDPVYTRVVVL